MGIMSKQDSLNQWWPRNVGRYRRKTASLSLMEHGAYALLLDEYYAIGGPLPGDLKILYRICGAMTKKERDSVAKIAQNFFSLLDGFYHNSTADEELVRRCDISEKRKYAANKRHANAPANASDLHPTDTDTIEDTIVSSPPVSPTPEFETLWNAWQPFDMPKGSKKKAFQNYNSALKKGISHETIFAAAAKYCADANQQRSKTKHLATWIYQECWNDDFSAGSHTGGRAAPGGYDDKMRRGAVKAALLLDQEDRERGL